MAQVRTLTDEEVTRLMRRRGAPVDLTPYIESMRDFEVGDWGVVELERYESAPAIKRRMTLAAKQQDKRLVWKRRRDNVLPFEVRTVEQTSAPAASKRGKQESAAPKRTNRRRASA